MLGVSNVKIGNTDHFVQLFSHSFDIDGDMEEEYHIVTDPNMPLMQHTRRWVPNEYKAGIVKKLDEMVLEAVKTYEEDSTPWGSLLTHHKGTDKSQQFCPDPKTRKGYYM